MSQLDLWRKNWDPFKELGLFPRWMDELHSPQLRQRMDKVVMSPSVEVNETKMAYLLRFDLPGVSKDQIKIDLHDNVLTVSGERKEERKEDDKKTHVSEVYYGSFSRSFNFPEGVDAERAEAKFENGVLNLTIPKKETSGKRQISIR